MRSLHHPHADELSLPDVLHALSDPVRLQIVRTLADHAEEQACSAVEATVSKSTLSHHFKVLREAGVTQTRANGTHRLISLRGADLDRRFPGLMPAVIAAARAGDANGDVALVPVGTGGPGTENPRESGQAPAESPRKDEPERLEAPSAA